MANLPENTSYTDPKSSALSKVMRQISSGVSTLKNAVSKYGGSRASTGKTGAVSVSSPGVTAVKQAFTPGGASEAFRKLGTVTTPYMGSTRYEPGGTHKGIDIANTEGTPIPAFAGGRVTKVVTGQGNNTGKGFGNYIEIQDDSGRTWKFSHLQQALVPVGSTVKEGQTIGTMGRSGAAYSTSGGTGTHLDLRVSQRVVDAWGKMTEQYLDPSRLL